jgi:DNA polymerase III alpha subunit (gram-positive type)
MFFDLETTGFPKKGEPIDIMEVGLRFVPNLGYSKNVESLSQLYSIDNVVPVEITMITGITGTMLEGKPHIREHIEMLRDWVNRADIVVAHNAPFDIRCLELIGVDFTGKEVFDTATHAKRLFPQLEKHSMSSVCEHLNIENLGAHRAIQDVNAMIKAYFEMTDLDKYGEQIEALLAKHKKLSYTKEAK